MIDGTINCYFQNRLITFRKYYSIKVSQPGFLSRLWLNVCSIGSFAPGLFVAAALRVVLAVLLVVDLRHRRTVRFLPGVLADRFAGALVIRVWAAGPPIGCLPPVRILPAVVVGIVPADRVTVGTPTIGVAVIIVGVFIAGLVIRRGRRCDHGHITGIADNSGGFIPHPAGSAGIVRVDDVLLE